MDGSLLELVAERSDLTVVPRMRLRCTAPGTLVTDLNRELKREVTSPCVV